MQGDLEVLFQKKHPHVVQAGISERAIDSVKENNINISSRLRWGVTAGRGALNLGKRHS